MASYVGETGYTPQYQQSMTVDHETNELYWAAYQSYTGDSNFYRVDKATGELTFLADVEYNGAMTALFKPYRTEKSLFPEDAALTGLQLSQDSLMLSQGKTAQLLCMPVPTMPSFPKWCGPPAIPMWRRLTAVASLPCRRGRLSSRPLPARFRFPVR